jgi:hypothetical protein
MSGGVTPLGKIVYVCDDVIQDPANGKLHVLGAFDAIRLPDGAGYPYLLGQMCVFAQMAGGRGSTVIEAKVIDAATGDTLFGSPVYRVNFPGGHTIVTLLIRLLDCPFPAAGTYVVQLFCQGAFVDDRRLTVM